MTKRLVRLAAATVAALAIPASSALADGSWVAGLGINNPPTTAPINYFAFAAHSDTGGANPFGFVGFSSVTQPFHVFVGPVTCMKVQGNEATMIIKIGYTLNQPVSLMGGGDIVWVQDNGNPARNGPPVDEVRNRQFPADQWSTLGASCPDPIDPGVPHLTSGNVIVHDGSLGT